jgi:hypothetical protein
MAYDLAYTIIASAMLAAALLFVGSLIGWRLY